MRQNIQSHKCVWISVATIGSGVKRKIGDHFISAGLSNSDILGLDGNWLPDYKAWNLDAEEKLEVGGEEISLTAHIYISYHPLRAY